MEPILLAVCELYEMKDVGFKITEEWADQEIGQVLKRALRDARVEQNFSDLVEKVNDGAVVFKASRTPLILEGSLKRVGINISSEIPQTAEEDRHVSATTVEPLVVFDPKRHALNVDVLGKQGHVPFNAKTAVIDMMKRLYFTRSYSRSGV